MVVFQPDGHDGESLRAAAGLSMSVVDKMAQQGADEIAFRSASWSMEADVLPNVASVIPFENGNASTEKGTFMQELCSSTLVDMLEMEHEDLQSFRLQLWKQANEAMSTLTETYRPRTARRSKPFLPEALKMSSDNRVVHDARLPPVSSRRTPRYRARQTGYLQLPLLSCRGPPSLPEIDEPNLPRNLHLKKSLKHRIPDIETPSSCHIEPPSLKQLPLPSCRGTPSLPQIDEPNTPRNLPHNLHLMKGCKL